MAKTPRLDAYSRAIARFYEPLVLLSVLRVRQCGPRTAVSIHPPGSLDTARRRLLKNLAVVCDYAKGGATTTALAVEDQDDGNVFWLAANQDGCDAAADFLTGVLDRLRGVCEGGQDAEEVEGGLMRDYAAFARQRLNKESKLLFRSATKCRAILEATPSGERDAELISWVSQFEQGRRTRMTDLCNLAYRSRHDDHARQIERLGADPDDGSAPGAECCAFRDLWHFIARTASHTRVIKQLVADAPRLRTLLLESPYRVAAVPGAAAAAAPPGADSLTTIPAMLNRMLKPSDARRQAISDQVALLDMRLGGSGTLEAAVREKLADARFAPRVHAEVRVLDHFHARDLDFLAGDRFVACSKAACFCCRLYFRHHPARCAEPDSHGNMHVNWGFARMPARADDAGWPTQLDILNKMNAEVRGVLFEKIAALGGPAVAQPDSVSGVTRSTAGVSDSNDESEGESAATADSDIQAASDSSLEPGPDSQGGADLV